MVCNNCNSSIDHNSKFCNQCGHPVVEKTEELVNANEMEILTIPEDEFAFKEVKDHTKELRFDADIHPVLGVEESDTEPQSPLFGLDDADQQALLQRFNQKATEENEINFIASLPGFDSVISTQPENKPDIVFPSLENITVNTPLTSDLVTPEPIINNITEESFKPIVEEAKPILPIETDPLVVENSFSLPGLDSFATTPEVPIISPVQPLPVEPVSIMPEPSNVQFDIPTIPDTNSQPSQAIDPSFNIPAMNDWKEPAEVEADRSEMLISDDTLLSAFAFDQLQTADAETSGSSFADIEFKETLPIMEPAIPIGATSPVASELPMTSMVQPEPILSVLPELMPQPVSTMPEFPPIPATFENPVVSQDMSGMTINPGVPVVEEQKETAFAVPEFPFEEFPPQQPVDIKTQDVLATYDQLYPNMEFSNIEQPVVQPAFGAIIEPTIKESSYQPNLMGQATSVIPPIAMPEVADAPFAPTIEVQSMTPMVQPGVPVVPMVDPNQETQTIPVSDIAQERQARHKKSVIKHIIFIILLIIIIVFVVFVLFYFPNDPLSALGFAYNR